VDLLLDLRRALRMLWHGIGLAFALLVNRWRRNKRPEVLIREMLQNMGLIGLKLGQFLALRADLLPPEVCKELGKLFESVTNMPFATVRAVIEEDLGEPLTNLFSDFNQEPIAAASVAQVHIARDRDGQVVAVKVQRPNLRRPLAADLRNLHRFAVVADFFGVLNEVSLVDLFDEFAKYTTRELDFAIEGQTAERLRAQAVCGEIVPRIFWGLSSRQVLTMEYIEGVSIAKASALLASGDEAELRRLLPGLDLQLSLHNLAFASMHQLYIVGFFHADPHPGNILLCPGNRIAFIDFGIFGEVSPMQRENLALHVEELVKGNIDQAARYYSRVYLPTAETDPRKLQRQARTVHRDWLDAVQSPNSSIESRTTARFSNDLLNVVRENHVRPSVDILLFVRGAVVVDSTIRQLKEDFDMLVELRDFFAKFRGGITDKMISMLTPEPLFPTLVELATTSANRLNEVMEGVVAGRFELSVTMRDAPWTARRQNVRARRIVLALVGGSLVMLVRVGDSVRLQLGACAAGLAFLALALFRWRR
jgi:ubiquinone biosynthesis protein